MAHVYKEKERIIFRVFRGPDVGISEEYRVTVIKVFKEIKQVCFNNQREVQ